MITKLIASTPRRIAAIVLIAGAVALSACNGSTPSTETTTTSADVTTTTVDPDAKVVFGKGSLPETMPTSFPIPEQSVVGATMIDRNRSVTEFVLTIPADVDAVVKFFEDNLPARGYVVSESDGTDGEWDLTFAGDGIEGSVDIRTAGAGLAHVAVSFTTPG